MSKLKPNKRKIFNDPVYGFVTIPDETIFDIVEHKYFQRLRRIKQLGLTHLVYPGALHTRFQHSLGAMHLMSRALNELRFKGHQITNEEAKGALIAILLHDVGHGPFSHALETSIVNKVDHESISRIFMSTLNKQFDGELETAIKISKGEYSLGYLTKLISGQFDMDRLDYLKRDSFFTGVSEGAVNNERLISMINTYNDDIVFEEKGIYSVEKFLTARRLMYWQVYLHKTVIIAEYTLMKVLKRARELAHNGTPLFATPALAFFLNNDISESDMTNNEEIVSKFADLDDYDITTSMKVWCNHDDFILSYLSRSIINRKLFKIELHNTPFSSDKIDEINNKVLSKFPVSKNELEYLVILNSTTNHKYKQGKGNIGILLKNGDVCDITDATEELDISVTSRPTTKHFICYPKEVL